MKLLYPIFFLVLLLVCVPIFSFAQSTSEAIEARGWDFGLTKRRVTTPNPPGTTTSIYFESCPDDEGGCYHNDGTGIKAGEGFYTLGLDIGGAFAPCIPNTRQSFIVTSKGSTTTLGSQQCPFFFAWRTNASGKLVAQIKIDNTNWSRFFTPNMWIGFHENYPVGTNYLGGRNFPTVKQSRFEFTVDTSSIAVDTKVAAGSKFRFITGIAWNNSVKKYRYTLEMNLDGLNVAQTPRWDPNTKVTRDCIENINGGQSSCNYFLGGRHFGIPSIFGNTPQVIIINWGEVINRLIQEGYLPADAINDTITPTVFHSGFEALGKVNLSADISNIKIARIISSTTAPLTHFVVSPPVEGDALSSRTFTMTMNSVNGTTTLATKTITGINSLAIDGLSLTEGSYDLYLSTPGYLKRKVNKALSNNLSISFPTLLAGNLNDDNIINILDWSYMRNEWNTANTKSDINKDGIVNSIDFSYLNKNWGLVGE